MHSKSTDALSYIESPIYLFQCSGLEISQDERLPSMVFVLLCLSIPIYVASVMQVGGVAASRPTAFYLQELYADKHIWPSKFNTFSYLSSEGSITESRMWCMSLDLRWDAGNTSPQCFVEKLAGERLLQDLASVY